MPLKKYLELLGKIDIAVFSHIRQQAMEKTTTLLGLGKKIYMRSDVTSWGFYAKLGVRIFDISNLDLLLINTHEATRNRRIISGYFSENKLKLKLKEIFK
jgi:dTDP-N-acetylfucosamine:lipid II N-acetylfucosaminyltransferase